MRLASIQQQQIHLRGHGSEDVGIQKDVIVQDQDRRCCRVQNQGVPHLCKRGEGRKVYREHMDETCTKADNFLVVLRVQEEFVIGIDGDQDRSIGVLADAADQASQQALASLECFGSNTVGHLIVFLQQNQADHRH